MKTKYLSVCVISKIILCLFVESEFQNLLPMSKPLLGPWVALLAGCWFVPLLVMGPVYLCYWLLTTCEGLLNLLIASSAAFL